MPPRIDAILFDLYGTLLRIGRPTLHRSIPRALGVSSRLWMKLVRERLLTSPFADRAEWVRFVCESLAPERALEAAPACQALVERELDSVELFEGVLPLLAFLKRRGYALGLVSNLTSIHKEPVKRLGLEEHFRATSYSCDTGIVKPHPRAYLDLCARLGVEPASVLVVGNSLPNDVEAPRALGMEALRVGSPSSGAGTTAADVGWTLIGGASHLERLVSNEKPVELGGRNLVLGALRPVRDEDQGRYNLVAHTQASSDDGASVEVFCKRFLFPEAAYVEELAHRLLRLIGMPSCEVLVQEGPEPCLLLSRAPGVKLEGEPSARAQGEPKGSPQPTVAGGGAPTTQEKQVGPHELIDDPDPVLAFELGRHCAVGYIFANADLRPRNAFVHRNGGRPVVTMVDLEHWFFNLALDLEGLDDPFRPETFDRLSKEEVDRRIQRHVLTERTTRRAMRSFLEIESESSDVGRSFKAGWIGAYRQVRSRGEEICRWIDQRVHQEPFLVIGTQSYRRAMARIDVEDIRRRMAEDPEALFPRLAALKREGE